MRFWAKQNWGERKLTIFSKPSLRRADGAEKSSFVLETRTGTGYYTSSDLLFQNKLAKLTLFIGFTIPWDAALKRTNDGTN